MRKGAITREQAHINRDTISKKLANGKSHDQIIEEMQIDRSTFYRYLKQIRENDIKEWSKVEIDNSKYRALALLKSFEETVRVCTLIINSDRTTNKDRIEALKTKDMANAHIYRLVEQGPVFQHLPEVKAIMVKNNIQQIPKPLIDRKVIEIPEDDYKET